MRLRGELRDELELLGREQHGRVTDADATRRAVEYEVARDDRVSGGGKPTPKQCADPREELLVRERSSDDVVGAAVERADAFDRVGRRRENDHRNVPVPVSPGLAAPQSQAEVELGNDDEVWARRLGDVERLAPASRSEHVE